LVPNAGAWYGTILPENYTFSNYYTVFTQDNTMLSIKNSLFYSVFSTTIALFLGILIAYLLTRRRIPGKNALDTVSMLPLALPGVALAFGYIGTFPGIFKGTFIESLLDARNDPRLLLIISYAVRRLPYMLRSVYAGLQQISITLEEASQNLGATPFKTMYKITLPLVIANLVAGSILVFSFSMLEVSDSLILSMKEQYHPITKVIYELSLWIEGGPYIASAMGVLGMILLATCLVLAGKFLGTRMGELFRA
jgi:iron(III) transport system permease protein